MNQFITFPEAGTSVANTTFTVPSYSDINASGMQMAGTLSSFRPREGAFSIHVKRLFTKVDITFGTDKNVTEVHINVGKFKNAARTVKPFGSSVISSTNSKDVTDTSVGGESFTKNDILTLYVPESISGNGMAPQLYIESYYVLDGKRYDKSGTFKLGTSGSAERNTRLTASYFDDLFDISNGGIIIDPWDPKPMAVAQCRAQKLTISKAADGNNDFQLRAVNGDIFVQDWMDDENGRTFDFRLIPFNDKAVTVEVFGNDNITTDRIEYESYAPLIVANTRGITLDNLNRRTGVPIKFNYCDVNGNEIYIEHSPVDGYFQETYYQEYLGTIYAKPSKELVEKGVEITGTGNGDGRIICTKSITSSLNLSEGLILSSEKNNSVIPQKVPVNLLMGDKLRVEYNFKVKARDFGDIDYCFSDWKDGDGRIQHADYYYNCNLKKTVVKNPSSCSYFFTDYGGDMYLECYSPEEVIEFFKNNHSEVFWNAQGLDDSLMPQCEPNFSLMRNEKIYNGNYFPLTDLTASDIMVDYDSQKKPIGLIVNVELDLIAYQPTGPSVAGFPSVSRRIVNEGNGNIMGNITQHSRLLISFSGYSGSYSYDISYQYKQAEDMEPNFVYTWYNGFNSGSATGAYTQDCGLYYDLGHPYFGNIVVTITNSNGETKSFSL